MESAGDGLSSIIVRVVSEFLFGELFVCFGVVEGLFVVGSFGVLFGEVMPLGLGMLMESGDTDLLMLFRGVLE